MTGAGNTVSELRKIDGTEDWAYAYDAAGRLAAVTVGGAAVADYRYNALGQQVSRTVQFGGGAAAVTLSVHDLKGQRLAEHDSGGAVIREYIWLDGLPLAIIEGGQTYWLHWDQIGRPVMATDATGAVVWAASYLPFGGIREVSVDTGALTQDLRFPDQWFQAETGLHQNWHRDYDPTTGRYLQADPLGLVDGPSVYGYARQNPQRWTDPDGLDAFVYYWDRGTIAGHLGIGTDFSEIYGQNPHPSGWKSCCSERPGKIKKEDYAAEGVYPPAGVLQVTLSDAMTRQLDVCINRRRIQSLPYRLLTESCVNFVRQCLAEVGVEISDRWRPSDFYNDLKKSASEYYEVYEIYSSTSTLNESQ